jgi:hypothetical protein
MTTWRAYVPETLLTSLLAALTTWVTLLAWTSFAERPEGYMVPLFGGCLMIAVLGMLLRSARVPALLVALAQVLLVLFWLHHRLAGDLALAGWFPDSTSVRALIIAINDSGLAAQAYAAPVPRSVPEFYPLLIIAGSMTAVLVDFLAVGLRRAPLAGLPLLAAYTAPVSVLDGGVSWVKFAAAALCFLFLIAAQEADRLARWGHQLAPESGIFDSQSTRVSGQAVWSSARKIGLTATGLAVVVPLFVPTFTATLFNGGNGTGDGDGDAVSISNPMVDLKRDLVQGQDVELVRRPPPGRIPGTCGSPCSTTTTGMRGVRPRVTSRSSNVRTAPSRGRPAWKPPWLHRRCARRCGSASSSSRSGCRRRTP